MITPQNVLRHELIGLEVLVVRTRNPSQHQLSGLIVNETRNMFGIWTERGLKHVAKETAMFQITLPCGTKVEILGSALVNAPERRIMVQTR